MWLIFNENFLKMKKFFLLIAFTLISFTTPALAKAKKVLFIGNSFTYGATASAQFYRSESITDLNKDGIGGVPAIFKALGKEAGFDFAVFAETVPGAGLDLHYDTKLPLIAKKWDIVIMHTYSTLDKDMPSNPDKLVKYSALLANIMRAKNPKVRLFLTATWSRADLVYKNEKSPWFNTPIEKMGKDIDTAYNLAQSNSKFENVLPVGEAWNLAISKGYADDNPFNGLEFGKFDLWGWDQYHASNYGYYLHALVDFAFVADFDVRKLGEKEIVARELGIAPWQAKQLQEIAMEIFESHYASDHNL